MNASDTSSEAGRTRGRRSRLRVLLMDDHPEVLTLLRITAELDGRFDIVGVATDGREAIDLASRLRPDVIVLDHLVDHLPRPTGAGRAMPGATAVTHLRMLLPDSVIVMYTGVVQGASANGDADLYCVKGEVDPATLLERIAHAAARAHG